MHDRSKLAQHTAPRAYSAENAIVRVLCRAGPHKRQMIELPPDGGKRRYRGSARQRCCYRWLGSRICRIPAYQSRILPQQQVWARVQLARCGGAHPDCGFAGSCVDVHRWASGGMWEAAHTLVMLKIAIVLTGSYSIISAVLTFLPNKTRTEHAQLKESPDSERPQVNLWLRRGGFMVHSPTSLNWSACDALPSPTDRLRFVVVRIGMNDQGRTVGVQKCWTCT